MSSAFNSEKSAFKKEADYLGIHGTEMTLPLFLTNLIAVGMVPPFGVALRTRTHGATRVLRVLKRANLIVQASKV